MNVSSPTSTTGYMKVSYLLQAEALVRRLGQQLQEEPLLDSRPVPEAPSKWYFGTRVTEE